MMIKRRWWAWGLLLLACVAYFLPWVWNPAAALSPNAYDLAEWTTLYPGVRQASPALLPSFLLRALPGILALLIVLQSSLIDSKWAGRILALWLIIVMLPPADFFLSAGNDINYRQQFYLSILTLLIALGIIAGNHKLPIQVQKALVLLFASLGIIVAIWGMSLGINTYRITFGVDSTIGGGVILFCGVLLIFGVDTVLSLTRTAKNQA